MSATHFNILLNRNLIRNASNSWRISALSLQRSFSTEEIVIPRRIQRKSTDILKALSSTVKNDSTAAAYRFHDDPFLIPFSTNAKRSFALSQEAGRKAARFIKDDYSELFQHRNAEPFIEAFSPAIKLTETTPVSEDMLIKCISSVQLQKAIAIYERMLDSKQDVSPQTKQFLLELVCFYNEKDQLDEDLFEERGLADPQTGMGARRGPVRRDWKDNGFAERLFNSLEVKSAEAFSCLICGMVKHGQGAGANEYYNQMLDQGFEPSLEVYNYIIEAVGIQNEQVDQKWKKVQEILTQIANCKMMPNVLTLNAVLQVISGFNSSLAKVKAKSTIVEFSSLGIKPSLATHYLLLMIFYREKGPSNHIIHDILFELEREMPPLQDIKDVLFFAKAMEVCSYQSNDLVAAKSLDKLLNRSNNQQFIGNVSNQSTYYRSFFKLLCRSSTPKDIMAEYNRLVPSVYSPELNVFEEILRTMNACSAVQYAPQLWSDAVYMNFNTRESMLEIMLETLANGKAPAEPNDEDPALLTTKAIWLNVETLIQQSETDSRAPSLRWSGTMLGHTMKVFLVHGKIKAAVEVMNKVHVSKNRLTSFVPFDILNLMVDSCIQTSNASAAMMVVEYVDDVGFSECTSMAEKIGSQLQLDDQQRNQLQNIIGSGVTKSKPTRPSAPAESTKYEKSKRPRSR